MPSSSASPPAPAFQEHPTGENEPFASTLVGMTTTTQETHGILTVTSGLEAGQIVGLRQGATITLGRAVDCGVSFVDRGLSRVHAAVGWVGGKYLLQDEKSRNGTFVNGARIEQPVELQNGDRIALGAQTTLHFSLVSHDEEQALQRTYESAVYDGLTRVFNRRQLDARLAAMIEAAQRENSQLALVMMDVDHFKLVNDTHGHQAGDEVLRATARLLVNGVRRSDMVARYGGEEFVLVVRGADALAAGLMADGLRALIEATPIQIDSRSIRVTVSAGVASLDECSPPTAAALLRVADARLYQAKQAGRNRIVGPF
jgi:diguanylate cyclase (GGDEF)-like protein